uniref:Protein YIF1 n=1 Tax=Plectus sambesii TaxID=2011161 RepID=A0A914VK00_9BILA
MADQDWGWDQPSNLNNRGHNGKQPHHGAQPYEQQSTGDDWNSWSSNNQSSVYPNLNQQQWGQYEQQGAYNPYTKTSTAGFDHSQPQYNANHGHQQPTDPYQQQIHQPDPYFNPLSTLAGGIPQQLMSDPMMNAARAYGEQFAGQQKEKISKYLSTYRLKYYFAVDNAYVGKKLGLLLFPFAHRDWSVKYGNSDEPVPARFDINAPDLYIPLMALVTYVLVAGFVLGTQGRFTPEQLGLLASNAVAWLVLENFFILVTKYVMNISQALSLWHTLAFSSYKFVGMIISLLVFLAFGRTAYYWTLGYFAVAVAFFLIRTVKTFVLEGPGAY